MVRMSLPINHVTSDINKLSHQSKNEILEEIITSYLQFLTFSHVKAYVFHLNQIGPHLGISAPLQKWIVDFFIQLITIYLIWKNI